jgi:hypothetical protein
VFVVVEGDRVKGCRSSISKAVKDSAKQKRSEFNFIFTSALQSTIRSSGRLLGSLTL